LLISLNFKELLAEIDNGSINTTAQLDFKTKALVHNSPNLISGESYEIEPNKPLKKELKLTKDGVEHLALLSLTLEDIDNKYGTKSWKEWLLKPTIYGILMLVITLVGTEFWKGYTKPEVGKVPPSQKTNLEKSNLNDSKQPPK